MKLADLAATLARLETTSSRTRSSTLVQQLFKAASPAELEQIVYLLQGQLRPPFEGVEFGLGEKLLLRVIANCYDDTAAAVTRRYRQLGDLGLVAEALAPARRTQLTVASGYTALLRIARASGAGAVEQKTTLLTALLRRATPLEARYLVRIVQGRLRLGVGDATIIAAATAGALRDPAQKPLIEHAYNVRSDLGAVVRLAYARGAAGLKRIAPKPGIPVRPALAQRLPSAAAIIGRLGTVQAEPKYDGFRLQLHRNGEQCWAFSRRLENVGEMFPDLLAALRQQRHATRIILDGEAVVQDAQTGRFLPFQVTITRKRKHGVAAAAKSHPLRFYAFDLLALDGRSMLPRTQSARSQRLAEVIRGTSRGPLRVTERATIAQADALQRHFRGMLRRGLEGVVVKRPDAPYQAGARGYDWVKLKRSYQSALRDTVDVVLVGYLKGRGKRASLGVGALLAAVYDEQGDRFRTVAKIGSGLSEAAWSALRRRLDRIALASRPARVDSLIEADVWVEPRLVVEVLADEITRSPRHTAGKSRGGAGYALRFPRMLGGVRRDKGPREATTEQEIRELYRLQRRRGRGNVAK